MTIEATLTNIAQTLERIAVALEARANTAPAAPAPAPTKGKKPAAQATALDVTPEPPSEPEAGETATPAPAPATPPTPPAATPELRDVQNVAVKAVNKLGLAAAQKLLTTFGSPDGRASTLPAENRAAFMRQAETQLAVAN